MIGASYVGLFLSAFLAATLVPFSSEALLGGMLATDEFEPEMLLVVASVGNTLGAVVNWLLGRFCLHWQDRRWFPVKPAQLDKASERFRRWGLWSLLFAWLPVVGDPLTFAAGVLRTPFWPFLVLVAAGKTARYVAVIFLFRTVAG